jgi:hypothetical protein
MNIYSLLKLVFVVPTVPKGTGNVSRERMHNIVAARSHGNIRLQAGEYYTKLDVDEKYEHYRDVRFATGS